MSVIKITIQQLLPDCYNSNGFWWRHDCFTHLDEHLLDHRLWQPILMKRYPNADPNATVADVVDPTEMVEIVREAETRTKTFTKSKIEQGAREVYRRLTPAGRGAYRRAASANAQLKSRNRLPTVRSLRAVCQQRV